MAGSEVLKKGGKSAVYDLVLEIGMRRLLGETYAQIAAALRVTRGVVAGVIHRYLRVTERNVTHAAPVVLEPDTQVVEVVEYVPQAVHLTEQHMTRILVAPDARRRIVDLGRCGYSVEEIQDVVPRVQLSLISRVLRAEGIEPQYSTHVCRTLAALRVDFDL